MVAPTVEQYYFAVGAFCERPPFAGLFLSYTGGASPSPTDEVCANIQRLAFSSGGRGTAIAVDEVFFEVIGSPLFAAQF